MSTSGHELDDPGWPFGPVVFGCGNFGGIGGARDFVGKGMSEEASLASMDEAAELGITLFDTAERCAGGGSERIVGRWLASRPASVTAGIRIWTKVGPPWVDGRDGRFDHGYINRIFSGSLERLGTTQSTCCTPTPPTTTHSDPPAMNRSGSKSRSRRSRRSGRAGE